MKKMKVGLFIPCYVDQFYPQVAVATLSLLEKLGVEVGYPLGQTCCGQPMANAGFEDTGKRAAALFVKNFAKYDYVVSPSGSCTLHVKEHFKKLITSAESERLSNQVYELSEFLVDVLRVEALSAKFPHRVGYHASCHGLRGLHLGPPSEVNQSVPSKPHHLLQMVEGLEMVELNRADECCGFGGTFAVSEAAISVKMGKDRIADHVTHGAEVITGGDVSCLMHIEGLLKRQKSPVRVMHLAEILNHS